MGYFFAIQDQETKMFLPVGGSAAEFSITKPPRLFRLPSHAESALSAWREGYWFNDIDAHGEGAGPRPYESKYNLELAERRKAMKLKVVAVRLLTKMES